MPRKNRRKPDSKWGTVTEEIVATIEAYGPMTRAEICRHLGRGKEVLGAVVSRLNKSWPEKPKRLYISHYVYDNEGERRYPRAVYALGDKPDKPRPKSDVKANRARHWAKKTMRLKSNSIFNMGLSRAKLMQMHKQIKEQQCTQSESTAA